MSKITLLSIIFITIFLSACGFNLSKNTSFNALIVSNTNNKLAAELKKHFNLNAKKSLLIEIGDEIRKKHPAAYQTNADTSHYTLTINVPIKIFRGKKLLFSKNLKTSSTINNTLSSQANRLQINENYAHLKNEIIKKILRILRQLNEN